MHGEPDNVFLRVSVSHKDFSRFERFESVLRPKSPCLARPVDPFLIDVSKHCERRPTPFVG